MEGEPNRNPWGVRRIDSPCFWIRPSHSGQSSPEFNSIPFRNLGPEFQPHDCMGGNHVRQQIDELFLHRKNASQAQQQTTGQRVADLLLAPSRGSQDDPRGIIGWNGSEPSIDAVW